MPVVRVRRSTWIWLSAFVGSVVAAGVLRRAGAEGCTRALVSGLILVTGLVVTFRLVAVLSRLVVRRLSLRLAFSYFLIGILPIPLLAALLALTGYLVAHQYVANQLRREITAVGEEAARSEGSLPEVAVSADGRVSSSDLAWLAPGAAAPRLRDLRRPGFLIEGREVWLAVPEKAAGRVRLLRLTNPEAPWLQRLADRTGYEVGIEIGSATKNESGFNIDLEEERRPGGVRVGVPGAPRPAAGARRRPQAGPAAGGSLWTREWIYAFYLETALNTPDQTPDAKDNLAVLEAKTSPEVVFHQLFSQGVPEIGRAFWAAFGGLAVALLLVYAAALAVAFVLVGSIARNVNRLTRATRAVARGDFSVRVESKSRDQIGDLTRSFDDMAASIERLLAETAHKERLESELAMARTVQHKLLPPPSASLPGLSIHASFEPVAALGGDYYDYLPLSGRRTALALGDVSGHGLATALLVAMAKAALSTLLEAGHERDELFSRLNELIHRSTDPRHFMTLAVLAYDPESRSGVLTNAGQLAPYLISAGTVEALSLPSFPLGLFPDRSFPSAPFVLASGDILVFHSDGLVEASNSADEPFGFERLEGVLRAHATEGAPALCRAILDAVREHTGAAPAEDDRTLLLATLD
jgi:serine phosphatase RsbU (regulator of sigma subunit)